MPNKPIVYLSGGMSGIPDWNFPLFDKFAQDLREKGYRVVNPADFGAKDRHTWRDCLCRDLGMLAHVDIVATLPNWHTSKGARLEVETAEALGIEIVTVFDLLLSLPPVPIRVDKDKPVETESRIRKLSGWICSLFSIESAL